MVCQPAQCTEQWLHGLVMYQVFLYPNGCFRSILLCLFQEEEGTVIADITAWRCGQAEQPPAAFSGESWKGKEEGGGREGGRGPPVSISHGVEIWNIIIHHWHRFSLLRE